MFTLNSDITIGKFRFKGAHKVEVNRSMHSLTDTATITLPADAVLNASGSSGTKRVITADQFAEGDPVHIMLGYNGDMKIEFRGFVQSRSKGRPLQVSCEGYSWLLSRNKVNISLRDVAVSKLLEYAVAGLQGGHKIKVVCETDGRFNNVRINGSGLDVIKLISEYSDANLVCFFIKPDTLWCGLPYSNYVSAGSIYNPSTVQYHKGYNIAAMDALKARTVATNPLLVTYSKKLGNGQSIAASSGSHATHVTQHNKTLNQVTSVDFMLALANEKVLRTAYNGYEGKLTTFLQPFAEPGYSCTLQQGSDTVSSPCLIEGVSVSYGVAGARRIVELGPSTNNRI